MVLAKLGDFHVVYLVNDASYDVRSMELLVSCKTEILWLGVLKLLAALFYLFAASEAAIAISLCTGIEEISIGRLIGGRDSGYLESDAGGT